MHNTIQSLLETSPRTDLLREFAALPGRRRLKSQVDETLIECADYIDAVNKKLTDLEELCTTLSAALQTEREVNRNNIIQFNHMIHNMNSFKYRLKRLFSKSHTHD